MRSENNQDVPSQMEQGWTKEQLTRVSLQVQVMIVSVYKGIFCEERKTRLGLIEKLFSFIWSEQRVDVIYCGTALQ